MNSEDTMLLRVVTPHGAIMEEATTSVALWTALGEIEVLHGHEPTIVLLEPGEMRARSNMLLLESLAQAAFNLLRQANRKHDLVAVQVTDPRELELPELGRLVFQDAETGEIVEVNTGDARKREAFAERQAKSQEQLARLFRKAGIDSIQLRTDQAYGVALGRFFETREKRRLRG